ncbi:MULTISPECIES: ABC transporter ATP-binding protein [unclassified Bacillus cereus group]|uniref:ABC transporter ATP-binding protein n=1 Tax=unclassified Bacillus cereus group TaxID=2750818 RepID=UPI001F5859E4|nr:MULTISPECIES: ATP-binding cassette domain-containing protein [unclassified Bacillus cereus group]
MNQKCILLEVSQIHKSFRNIPVVEEMSFQIYEGEVVGFIGPNGAGKTTTIRMILNLIHRDGGSVKISGYDIDSEFSLAMKKVGAIVENPSFHRNLSGYKNLKLIANLNDVSEKRIWEVLNLVQLQTRAKDKVKEYSLGMKQRLGIAMSLLKKPDLLILDEPTNGLDPQGIRDMRRMMKELAEKEKIGLLISSHILHELEQICTRFLILNKGKIVLDCKRENLNQEIGSLEHVFLDAVEGGIAYA